MNSFLLLWMMIKFSLCLPLKQMCFHIPWCAIHLLCKKQWKTNRRHHINCSVGLKMMLGQVQKPFFPLAILAFCKILWPQILQMCCCYCLHRNNSSVESGSINTTKTVFIKKHDDDELCLIILSGSVCCRTICERWKMSKICRMYLV